MISFGKSKDNKVVKKHRYDLTSIDDEEIADVLLTDKQAAPLAAASAQAELNKGTEFMGRPNRDEKAKADELAMIASLSEQVKKLCGEYEAINQRLENSLAAFNDLTKQPKPSKKVVTVSYVALGVACVAVMAGMGAVVFAMNMQRDLDDLNNSVTSLTVQVAMAKKQTALKTNEMNGQVVQLKDRVDKIFTVENLDNVLEVTKELRKQVRILADKNLAMMNAQNQDVNESLKANKIALPSLKIEKEKELPTDTKLPTGQDTKKLSPASKVDLGAEKKKLDIELAAADNSRNIDEAGNWVVTFGTFKDKAVLKNTVDKFKKADIPVEIAQITLKKHVWYRATSKTFKTKQEAQNYAERIKRTVGNHTVVQIKAK